MAIASADRRHPARASPDLAGGIWKGEQDEVEPGDQHTAAERNRRQPPRTTLVAAHDEPQTAQKEDQEQDAQSNQMIASPVASRVLGVVGSVACCGFGKAAAHP